MVHSLPYLLTACVRLESKRGRVSRDEGRGVSRAKVDGRTEGGWCLLCLRSSADSHRYTPSLLTSPFFPSLQSLESVTPRGGVPWSSLGLTFRKVKRSFLF